MTEEKNQRSGEGRAGPVSPVGPVGAVAPVVGGVPAHDIEEA